MPEQPPPTTRILRLHSGLPSSGRGSSIFLAAVSVNVIILASLGTSGIGAGATPRTPSLYQSFRIRQPGPAGGPKSPRRLKKVQLRGGAREPHARRSLSTLSVRPRAPTKQMGLFQP